MKSKILILILLFSTFLNASIDILKTSQIYIDPTGKETIKTISSKNF